jgi:hypothetical protein
MRSEPRCISKITAAEISLGDLEQPLLVLVRQAQDHHDDAQWVPDGDVVYIVAFPAEREQPVDACPRQPRYLLLDLAELARLEPSVRQLLIGAGIRIVYLVDGADQHWPAAHHILELLLEFYCEQLGALGIDEASVLPLDLDDVLMLGDRPERAVAARRRRLSESIPQCAL